MTGRIERNLSTPQIIDNFTLKLKRYGLEPHQAREILILRGFTTDITPLLAESPLVGAHIDRVLARIATGEETRLPDQVFDELYSDDLEHDKFRKIQMKDEIEAFRKKLSTS